MPSITLTFTVAQATRIQEALVPTDYPATQAGYKAMLVDYTRSFVQEYEKAQAEQAALASVAAPADLSVS